MKKKLCLIGFILSIVFIEVSGQVRTVSFKSSDTTITQAFIWAKKTALHYKENSNDPVGPWYDASLPGRYAFCMRDVSHQCVGAEILGMSKENKNMFTKFVSNISKSKDWCSYWEINKWNKPAPVDYKNDQEFWYNLDANFDIMYACWRLFLWTGDKYYIDSPLFILFFKKTLNDYIKQWVLEPDSLLSRPMHPGQSSPAIGDNPFQKSRGIPSYVESVPGLRMSSDLISAIYQGFISFGAILKIQGNHLKSKEYFRKAKTYQDILMSKWWDKKANLCYTYTTDDGKSGFGEGETFLLWFNILKDTNKINSTIDYLSSHRWNVETTSYLPYLFYINNHDKDARKTILFLSNPNTKRRDYPEVSFGVIQGIVLGYMGIKPEGPSNTIRTLFRGGQSDTAQINNLPVLNSIIKIKYDGWKKVTMENQGQSLFNWEPQFKGKHRIIYVNGKKMKANFVNNKNGEVISYVNIPIKPHQEVKVRVS